MSGSALELRDVRKRFGRAEIIRGANLQVEKGERCAIIGPNGAGKSTLFNLITGRFPASSGEILLNGSNIMGLKPFEIYRRGLSRGFQITNVFHRLSVYENLRCSVLWSLGYRYSFWQRLSDLPDVKERADEVLDLIGLRDRQHTPAGLLTYAEQRALDIGITIAGDAAVILLDEPTAGMSRSETDATVEMIRRITKGKTLLIVEHDMSVVFALAEKIAVLVYGEIIASSAPEDIRNNPRVREAYLGEYSTVDRTE